MAAFMDLHVKHCDQKVLAEKLLKAEHLGYEVVAINYFLDELQKPKQKGKKEKQPYIPQPEEIKVPPETTEKMKWRRRAPRQLSRLSTVIKDSSQTHKLTSQEVQSYDLIAVEPTSEKTFQQACSTLEIDIITLDVTQRLPFMIKRPSVNSAIQRGIHFELQYGPALHDSSIRRQMISNAVSLVDLCKGKNVILTSACEKPIDLRGPHDVANLALLFGMTEAQGKAAVCKNCRALLYHAEARKVFKSTISLIKISSSQSAKANSQESCSKAKREMKTDSKVTEEDSVAKQENGVNSHRNIDKGHLNESVEDNDEPCPKRLKVIQA